MKRAMQFIVLTFTSMMLCACPYVFHVPIDDAKEKIDTKLIGKWKRVRGYGANFMDVKRQDEYHYYIKYSNGLCRTKGWLTTVRGFKILNTGGRNAYSFAIIDSLSDDLLFITNYYPHTIYPDSSIQLKDFVDNDLKNYTKHFLFSDLLIRVK
ncbi:MAG: hypothetical protein JST82_04575 [Bacteroidetes bacterium]|nr:hypothetical protein [Bacteroidota bacterium]